MDGYRLFKRDRQGRKGGGVALYIKKERECMEINDGDDRVRIKAKADRTDIIIGVCYRLPNQDEEVDIDSWRGLKVTPPCSCGGLQLPRHLLSL